MKNIGAVITLVCLMFLCKYAGAQNSAHYARLYKDIIGSSSYINGIDNFGESINPQTGDLAFSMDDLTSTGNGPSIVINRSTSVQGGSQDNWNHGNAFADWALSMPRLTTNVPHRGINGPGGQPGEFVPLGTWPGGDGSLLTRCSTYGAAGGFGTWGMRLDIPGSGVQEVLVKFPGNSRSPVMAINGASIGFPLTTKNGWEVGCIPDGVKNGHPGEAFLVVSPEGVKYRFDWMTFDYIGRWEPPLFSGTEITLLRANLYPTKIEDRFGNYVNYLYQDYRLVGIEASDGRKIQIEWTGSMRRDPDISARRFISKIIVNPDAGRREFGYRYALGTHSPTTNPTAKQWKLVGVDLPDGSSWTYNLNAFDYVCQDSGNHCVVPMWASSLIPGYTYPYEGTGMGVAYVTAPSGATASYTLARGFISRNGAANALFGDSTTFIGGRIKSKRYSGPGLDQTWNYIFKSEHPYKSNVQSAEMHVTNPDGSKIVTIVDNRAGDGVTQNILEGHVTSVRTYSSAGALLRSQSYEYNANFSSIFRAGKSWSASLAQKGEYLPNLVEESVVQDGMKFRRIVEQFDGFGRPLRVTRKMEPL